MRSGRRSRRLASGRGSRWRGRLPRDLDRTSRSGALLIGPAASHNQEIGSALDGPTQDLVSRLAPGQLRLAAKAQPLGSQARFTEDALPRFALRRVERLRVRPSSPRAGGTSQKGLQTVPGTGVDHMDQEKIMIRP